MLIFSSAENWSRRLHELSSPASSPRELSDFHKLLQFSVILLYYLDAP